MIVLECQFRDQVPYRRVFNQAQIIIGTALEAVVDLNLLPDEKISANHARLYHYMGWWIEDLGSTTGISVNGDLVLARRHLNNSDVIELGDTQISIRFEQSDDQITVEEGDISVKKPLPVLFHGKSSSEYRGLPLDQLDKQIQKKSGEQKIRAIVDFLHEELPSPNNVSIVLNSDHQRIPLVYSNLGRSSVSFRLTQRCLENREALIWERSVASLDSISTPSLHNTISAIYTPIIDRIQVVGIIAVDTSSMSVQFEDLHLSTVVNIARRYASTIRQELGSLIHNIPSIFLSYSHQDIDFVRKLANDLRRIPINVWYDDRLRLAKKWNKQIEDAIRQMDVFGVIWSPDSVKSMHVQSEIEYAKLYNKPIFSLLYKPCELSSEFNEMQYQFIGENYTSSIQRLLDDIVECKIDVPSRIIKEMIPPADTGRLGADLSTQQINRLVDLLIACPSIADVNTREAVIRQLPSQIISAIPRSSQSKVDVLNIVRTCLNFEGGINKLIDSVRFFDEGTIQVQRLDAFIEA